jgi:phage terminase large subunit-like protein
MLGGPWEVGRAAGERLWPEWYTDDMVSLAKRDPRVWSALYQQEPRPGEGGEFRREWLRYYGDCKAGAGMNKILLVDPASGKRATNDYTSMWIIGLSPDSNYYVLDMVRDRLNLSERAEKVFSLHRKWKPYQVRYERYGMMADIEHMESCMDRENYRFKITEVGGGLKKEDRIRRTLPMFQDAKFYLPNTFWYTRTDGIVYDLVDEFINQEYLAFPVGRHDDMMDGLARIAEPGKDFELKWPGKSRAEFEPIKSYALLDSVAGY